MDFNALAEVVAEGKMAAKEKAELDTTEEKVCVFPFQLWLAYQCSQSWSVTDGNSD